MGETSPRADILDQRFYSHTSAWFAAVLTKTRTNAGIDRPVLVHIEHTETGRAITEPASLAARQEFGLAIGAYILRPLGMGDYIVTFEDDGKYDELFKKGYLIYQAAGYRVIAL